MKTWEEKWRERIAISELEHEKAGWGSEEGQIARFSMVKNLLGLEGNESIIDFGCGTGLFYQYLKAEYPNLRCVGYDVVVDVLQTALNRGLDNTVFLCEKVGAGKLFGVFPDCDVVTAIGLFQNFDGSAAIAVAEAFSCLKSGGHFVVVTLNHLFEGSYEVKFNLDGKAHTAFDSGILDWVFRDAGFKDVREYSFSAEKGELSEDIMKYHELVIVGGRP